jgi:hypothetical protein
VSVAPVFHGRVLGGKLCLERKEEFGARVRSLEGKPVDLVLRQHRRSRSGQQNRYYWGVVLAIFGASVGYSAEELHEALKHKFLRDHPESPIPRVRSTTDLNTKEFSEFVEKVRKLAAEMGCPIPSPGEADGSWCY